MFIFETLINVFQSIVVTVFLSHCLEIRNNNGKNYFLFTLLSFMYLEIVLIITPFEGAGIIIALIYEFILSVIFFSSSFINKLIFNVILIITTVFSSIVGAGIIGCLYNMSYIQMTDNATYIKCFSMLLTQVIWCFELYMIDKRYKDSIQNINKKHIIYSLAVPLISLLICCAVVYMSANLTGINVFYSILVVIGILILNLIDLNLSIIEGRTYNKWIANELYVNSYRLQEKNIENIKYQYKEIQKLRHDFKKILLMLSNFIHNKEYDNAEKYLKEINISSLDDKNRQIYYSNNIILNYVLNETKNECENKNIDFAAYVNGCIDGIEDLDFHILLSNMLSNAIEATQWLEIKNIYLLIDSSNDKVNIKLENSANENAINNIIKMQSSKKDKWHHGYGLENINNIVNKYQGNIKYQSNKNMITCELYIMKKK